MILTVTPNPALDVTYRVEELRAGEVHRVEVVAARAGGKGVNVASVLAALGAEVALTGPLGGTTGQHVRQDLARRGLADAFVPVAAETRRTVTVVDRAGTATVLNEPGPRVDAAAWAAVRERVRGLGAGASAVVVSGSLPPGVGEDAYAALVAEAVAVAPAVLVDASGPALLAACRAGPAVVGPNAAELRAATGAADPLAGAEVLLAAGAGAVVVSRGADGLLAVTADGCWSAVLPDPVRGNPTGAGDAAVAALALGQVRGDGWPERLRATAAVAAAAVEAPVAGQVDPARAARLRSAVRVRPELRPAAPP